MKLLHVLAQLPTRTGSGVYFSNLIKNFKKYDYEQKAIFGTQDDFKWDLLAEEDISFVRFKTDEVPFPIAGMSDVMPYENTLYCEMTDEMYEKWMAAFRKRLLAIKESYQPDVIFAHHLWILTSIVAEIFPDAKIVGVFHNTDMRQAQMYPHLYEKYVDNLDQLDLVLAASEEQIDKIAETYKEIDREKIVVVGAGYDQHIFYPAEKKRIWR